MNINSINNSGDWNTFNQNIGGRTVEDIFDKDELAQEWFHKKMVRDNAFSARMKRSSVEVVVAVILLAIYFFIAKASGDFDTKDAFLKFMRDVFSGSILPLLRTVLFGFGGVIAALGVGGFFRRDAVERRNHQGMMLIDQRAEDLGFKKKDWNIAKRRAKSNN